MEASCLARHWSQFMIIQLVLYWAPQWNPLYICCSSHFGTDQCVYCKSIILFCQMEQVRWNGYFGVLLKFLDFLLKHSGLHSLFCLCCFIFYVAFNGTPKRSMVPGGGRGGACAICLEPPNCPVGTNCGHTFCASCILRWQHEKRPEPCQCPVCRRQVDL